MAKVDVHSKTWKEIKKFINNESGDAMLSLIADRDSDQQRGVLKLLDRLLKLEDPEPELLITDDYK